MEPVENTTNQATPQPPEPQRPKEGSFGPTLAIILIIILIALGGLYYFTKGVDYSYDGQYESDPAIEAMQAQGSSDEIAEIEADLEATDFSEIDALMLELDAELEAGL